MSLRPVGQPNVLRVFAEHALRRGVEDEELLVAPGHNDGISHVGQDRLEDSVSLREVGWGAMPVMCHAPRVLDGFAV